jgi:hypothetical protein
MVDGAGLTYLSGILMVVYMPIRIPLMTLIEMICAQTEYRDDGNLIWKYLSRRKERIGRIAGSKSNSDGYVYIKLCGKKVGAHRVIFYMHHGWVPEEVDHKNRIRHDNRIDNLRDPGSHTNNLGNQSHQTGRSSKYKGVCWDKSRGKWMAMIKNNRKKNFLGRFSDEKLAAQAYNDAAISFFGEFAHINEV